MMLKQIIICSTLLLQQSVVWAGSIDAVLAGLNTFTQDSNQADEDVQKVNAVNGMAYASKIPSTIQRLENDADGVVQDALDVWDSIEIKVTNDIIEALDSATSSMDKFLEDLVEEAPVLNELGEGSAIYTALGALESSYGSLTGAIEGLLSSPTLKNTALETGNDGIAALDTARNKFEPLVG